jgi:hypothetical protein
VRARTREAIETFATPTTSSGSFGTRAHSSTEISLSGTDTPVEFGSASVACSLGQW